MPSSPPTATHTTADDTPRNLGLSREDAAWLAAIADYADDVLDDKYLATGELARSHGQHVALILAELGTDAVTRGAAYLFLVDYLLIGQDDHHGHKKTAQEEKLRDQLAERFGTEVMRLVAPMRQLLKLSAITKSHVVPGLSAKETRGANQQTEVLRKMLLAMASDLRVVLLRLASRLQTLRFFAAQRKMGSDPISENMGSDPIFAVLEFAHETMEIYAPLANRLGIGQLKWELEDLAFRFIEPDTYRQVAKLLDEKRLEREQFIATAIQRLQHELDKQGIKVNVTGRAKHIHSIVNKMRSKGLSYEQLYDVRGLRVLCRDTKDCYTVLSVLHDLWKPITQEFDDYIARPKPNGYQSLHTVLMAEDGRPFEVQIRTHDMHQFAEFGVAAHWRYKVGHTKETPEKNEQNYDTKVAWLRQLLAWKSEVSTNVVAPNAWAEKLNTATLDERIYVLTPDARVVDLPVDATPIDFAYHLHSELGHRCRGARVDGLMVPLNTPLKNAQTVEIISAKQGGPSRDWLNESLGFVRSSRARTKVRQWFNAIELQETLAQGRAIVDKELQRLGKTATNLEDLAQLAGFEKADDFFIALGREAIRPRQIAQALGLVPQFDAEEAEAALVTRASSPTSVEHGAQSGVLVVGVSALMTQLARCCRPAPPDSIVGFVTRGHGVSIHRASCSNLANMLRRAPERNIEVTWGKSSGTLYPVDLVVLAHDRQGLLRDISEVLSRERINVTGVNTQSERQQAHMEFTVEISDTPHLKRAIALIRDVSGVFAVRRK